MLGAYYDLVCKKLPVIWLSILMDVDALSNAQLTGPDSPWDSVRSDYLELCRDRVVHLDSFRFLRRTRPAPGEENSDAIPTTKEEEDYVR